MQVHGSIPYAELREMGLSPEAITDFSATVNPFPVPREILETIAHVSLSSYPDPQSYNALSVLAEFHKIPVEWCTLTTGMTEPIFILPRFFSSADYFIPSYGDYGSAFRRYGRRLQGIPFPCSEDEWGSTLDTLHRSSSGLLIICNPNNPDGNYLPAGKIETLCRSFPDRTLYIDESYQEMGENCSSAVGLTEKYTNLLVAKSLTKPFGIGGIRVAYLIGSGSILENIHSWLIPWGVSLIAQALVPELFAMWNTFRTQWEKIQKEKASLTQAITAMGYGVNQSRAPYFLVTVGNAADIRKQLLKDYKIHIRDCTSFGMPDTIRIMPRIPEENARLLKYMKLIA
jgi:histidinol-phosphate aminotransferase